MAVLGPLLGVAVRRRGLGANIMAGFDALGDGEALDEYRDQLAATRREALTRMAAGAAGLGGNAIVGVRFDAAEVGHHMVEVVAYGSAVAVAPDGHPVRRPASQSVRPAIRRAVTRAIPAFATGYTGTGLVTQHARSRALPPASSARIRRRR
jgi:uncharacterized protein YbjQ (UPF0145 family)